MDELTGVWCVHVHVYDEMDGWMYELMGVWCVHVHVHVYG